MKTKSIFQFILILCFPLFSIGQTTDISEVERAELIAREAIKELNRGNYDQAISIFERCTQYDPLNIDYPYELAFSHKLKGDTLMAINILRNLRKHPRCNAMVYHLLAISQHEYGQVDKAINNLTDGILRFKRSGILYYQLGLYITDKNDPFDVAGVFEEGILNDPNFAGNYYEATKFFIEQMKPLGLMYGEIFCNLERNTERTAEISKLLYQAYRDIMVFGLNDPPLHHRGEIDPFVLKIEQTLDSLPELDSNPGMNALIKFNRELQSNYLAGQYFEQNPNIIIALREELAYLGHLESYFYWLFWQGNEKEFDLWIETNQSDFVAFLEWFRDNKIRLNAINKFLKD